MISGGNLEPTIEASELSLAAAVRPRIEEAKTATWRPPGKHVQVDPLTRHKAAETLKDTVRKDDRFGRSNTTNGSDLVLSCVHDWHKSLATPSRRAE